MDIIETLKAQREAIEADRDIACKPFDIALAEIDVAIKAIMDQRDPLDFLEFTETDVDEAFSKLRQRETQMPIDAAIIEAVRCGAQKPAAVLKFIQVHLNVDTTINSVRTRLSRLNAEGRVSRDVGGWVVPQEISQGTPLNENEPPMGGSETGEVNASSDMPESQKSGNPLSQLS